VIEADLPVGRASDKFDDGGRLSDPETDERLQEVVQALVEHHRALLATV
jgi:hypothetical protein